MKSIVIVGSGPVGSFIAVLCAQLGFPVTVYEKREEFTRNINLKIESNFFKEVQEVFSRLNVKTDFFANLNEYLLSQRNKILIKELEQRFVEKAKSLGAIYIIREVESSVELYKKHETSDPLILDCTGRNSKLRVHEFGPDKYNIVTTPLQHAMYINFKAKIMDSVPSLYQVMKYIKTIKLTELVLSKCKDKDGFSDVTLPVFITDELALVFDKKYPNINREPVNPFNSSNRVPEIIFFPISSLIGNLIMDGCRVDLNSVKVKKIEISCGYAGRRSTENYVCLGDSAIHLAFFRSLNLGLRHALEFFIKLSMLQTHNVRQAPYEYEIIRKFTEQRPHLSPVSVYPTVARNVFLVVTKLIKYGCYSYCLTNHNIERLTEFSGVDESEIMNILYRFNKNLDIWSNLLADFEAKRDKDIQNEILSNKTKSTLSDYTSWFIDVNGKSFIKISEFARVASGKCAFYHEDFTFLLQCFEVRRQAIAYGSMNAISSLVNHLEGRQYDRLKAICAQHNLSDEEKLVLLYNIINRQSISIENHIKHVSRYVTTGLHINSFLPTGVKKLLKTDDPSVTSDFIFVLIKNEIALTQRLSFEPDPTPHTASSIPGPSWQR